MGLLKPRGSDRIQRGSIRGHIKDIARVGSVDDDLLENVAKGSMEGGAEEVAGYRQHLPGGRGEIVDRYDKRFCTEGDLKYYSPGDHFVTFELKGIRCGLLICYDIRFPELYREYAKLGVRLMFHSFYNARQKEGSIHPKIMPPTAQAYAAANAMYISLNNASAPRSWESRFVTPDGLIERSLILDEPGVMINVVDPAKTFYDASGKFRINALNGTLNSGDVISDPKSTDRKSF